RAEQSLSVMEPQFGAFTASELYCPKCGRAQPVRERLLLVLPTGELHEFVCAQCATSLGKRTVTGPAVPPRAVAARRPARKPHHLLR
ncbi:MAG: hypothetical protein KGS61_14295, partial [Verrucomicrobia bacterium]|nr:hypothetical protein [Verrucomicrobiota bacterium]